MVIDIIDYNDAQYMQLGEVRLQRVREAQLEKNELLNQLARDKRREKYKLLKNGVYRSGIYESVCAELERQCQEQINVIRDSLLFYLRFAIREDLAGKDAPYPLDYSLSATERAEVVLEYYQTTYTNPNERYKAFIEDEFAAAYLGDMYYAVHDYIMSLIGG